MLRSDVVNRFLDFYRSPTYLEVGVDAGTTFFAVNAHRKVAVDPHFKFSIQDRLKIAANEEFHSIPSDDYFANIHDQKFDIVFLDGLHTFEQILKDFQNALAVIQPNGIIIIDDVIPSSYHASLPDLSRSFELRRKIGLNDGDWMGDVYKIVYYIESFCQAYKFATVAENHGQMIVWRESRPANALVERRLEHIAGLSYCDAILTDAFNLRPCEEIASLCKQAYNFE